MKVGEQRRLQNEEIHSLYRSPFNILKGKPIGKRPLGSPRSRWEDNARLYIKDISVNTRKFIDLERHFEFSFVILLPIRSFGEII